MGVLPIGGWGSSGGSSLPAASGAGEIPASTGAGTAYTAVARATMVQAALSDDPATARSVLGAINATIGHRWERPSPSGVPSGTVFIDRDDLSEQVSSGLAVSAGVAASGWMRRLPSGLGNGRAGLSGAPARAYVDSLDISGYTIGAASFAALWTWDGTQPATYGISEIVTFGDRDNETRGIHLAYVTNGANSDLVAYTGGSVTVLLASANLAAGAVGLHAIAIAPVNVGGTHKWRFSLDGSAVADVTMGANYAPPLNTDSIGVGARPDGLIYLNGRFIELGVWGSLLSNANLFALATLPGTPTYELPESSSTGAAAIRVQACRYDPAASTLPAKGVGKPFTVASSTSKVDL